MSQKKEEKLSVLGDTIPLYVEISKRKKIVGVYCSIHCKSRSKQIFVILWFSYNFASRFCSEISKFFEHSPQPPLKGTILQVYCITLSRKISWPPDTFWGDVESQMQGVYKQGQKQLK